MFKLKITPYFLSLMMLFAVASCGGNDGTDENVTPDTGDTGGSDDGGSDDGGSDDGGSDDGGTDDGGTDEPDPTIDESIPASFVQRYYIEQVTGTWCGWCPVGKHEMSELLNDHPERVVATSVHSGDGMEHRNQISYLDDNFGISGYPGGLVNRLRSVRSGDLVMYPTEWRESIESRMDGAESPVGFQVDTELVDGQAGTKDIQISVRVGFTENVEAGNDYRINVALLENDVLEDQQNYLSGDSRFEGHPYYSQPAVLVDYAHKKVYRKNLTALGGDEIPVETVKAQGFYDAEFTLNLARYIPENCEVVVFVTTGNSNYVENAIGTVAGEDVMDWSGE